MKLTQAEKQRRKEEAIRERATHYLNIMYACAHDLEYNGVQWKNEQLYEYSHLWDGFRWGLILGDGLKWHRRMQKMYREYTALHPIFPTDERRA